MYIPGEGGGAVAGIIGHGVFRGQTAGDGNVVIIADTGLHLDVNVAVRSGHAVIRVGGAGRILGYKDVIAAGDGRIGHRENIVGALGHDLCRGVHAGQQVAHLVDADGNGVRGGTAGGGACLGDTGNHALKGLAGNGIGGNGGFLALLDVEDVQLVHVQGHFQVAHIVDDAHGIGRCRAGAHGITHLDILGNDRAADGSGDGVIVHLLLGVFHRELGAAQVVGGVEHLLGQVIARELDQGRVGADLSSLLDAESGDGAAVLGGNALLTLVAEPGGRQGADAVDGGSGRLGSGQVAGVADRDGHGADQQVAAAEGIRAGDGLHAAGDGLKGAVQQHLRTLAHGKVGGVRCRELQLQQQGGVVPDGGDFLPCVDHIAYPHFKGSDGAGNVGADVLGVHSVIVAALGLAEVQLCLFHAADDIGAVDGVKDRALFHHIAHLKIRGQDIALDRRLDGVAVGGAQHA